MKLTIELEEPYAKELELRAYRSGQTVKEYVEECMRANAEADMSFDEKISLHKELADRTKQD
jgi:predicted HAD superfamily Cof-like phosphohydrolase